MKIANPVPVPSTCRDGGYNFEGIAPIRPLAGDLVEEERMGRDRGC